MGTAVSTGVGARRAATGAKVPGRGVDRRRWQALALVAPLALFLLFAFAAPIAAILSRGVFDDELSAAWPGVAAAVKDWDGRDLPGEGVYAALARDMKASQEARTTAAPARRLNYALEGGRALVTNTARRVARVDDPGPAGWKGAFIAADPAWGEAETWRALRQASGPVSAFFLLQALDLRWSGEGLARTAEDARIYAKVMARTFGIALMVTVICLLLGFPVAYFLANASPRWAAVAMILVLVPLWTSVLVRTAAWVVLLQDQGLVNGALRWLGLVEQPVRLIFNRIGVTVAMVHVSLPFMILPIYATMATIRPDYMRAARSLGAPPWTALRRVYLPQTVPGVAAGVLLVFITALGYYITPALVGGADDQMISYFIAFHTTDTVNWGLAGGLGIVLIAATAVLYALYLRLSGGRPVSLG